MRARIVGDLAGGVIGIVALAGVTLGGYTVAAGWAGGWMALYSQFDGNGAVCYVYPSPDMGGPDDLCAFLGSNSRWSH